MTKQVQLQRVPNVLQASIGASTKRERKIGRYHVSDLLGLGVEAGARLYAGLDPEPDFPAYLARRGLILEDMALASLPSTQRQPEITFLRAGQSSKFMVVGHPDGVTLDEAGEHPVLLEVASQLSEDDADKEDTKRDQALTYAGLVNMGGVLALRDGTPVPGEVTEVRVILCGLYGGAEIPYTQIHAEARERAEWVVAKAVLLDDLARALEHASGVGEDVEDHAQIQAVVDKPLAAARQWDERFPARAGYETEAVPVLEGERGEFADQTVERYKAWKWNEERFREENRKRWLATLDLDTLKKVAAPGGGTITLRKRTVQELDPGVYAKMDGPELEEQLERAVARLDEDLRPLRDELERKREAHPATRDIALLNEMIEKAREAATRTVEKPNGLLVTPPRGWKKNMEAGA